MNWDIYSFRGHGRLNARIMRLVGPAVLMSLFRAGIDVTARPRDESCNQSPGAGIDSFRVRPRCDFHAAGALRRRFVH